LAKRELIEFVADALVNRILKAREYQRVLLKDQKDMANVQSDDELTFLVALKSGWSDFGEKPLTYSLKGSLEEAIKQACGAFKDINQKNDVQAYCQVFILLPQKSVDIEVPEEHWLRFFKKYSRPE